MSVYIPMEAQKLGRFAYENCQEETEFESDKVITNEKGETLYSLICRFTPIEEDEAVTARVKIFLPEKPRIGKNYPSLDFDGFAFCCWENGRKLAGYFVADGFKVIRDDEQEEPRKKQAAQPQQAAARAQRS